MAITFDTLKFVERLEASGIPHAQAKATAEAFAEATSQELATKADIKEVQSDMALGFAKAHGEIILLKWMMVAILAGVAPLVVKSFFG